MKTAIILHGMPSREEYFVPNAESPSNNHWIPWLQKQLILQGVLAQTPELPEPYAPDYEKWLGVFEQFNVGKDTMLIGHSCGAGFLVRWLSETKKQVGKVALVAPFLDPDHDEVPKGFFDFVLARDLASKTQGVRVFYSTDDDREITDSVKQILSLPEVGVTELFGKKHLTLEDMGTREFPELLSWLV